MILGLGTDIIEIDRIALVIDRHGQRFLDRVFSAEEQVYCQKHKQSAERFSGRFAAKEAVLKALGTGLVGGISWLDIAIINDEQGKPEVSLSGALLSAFEGGRILLSISHCRSYATAVAVWQAL